MSRKPHEPTAESRQLVQLHTTVGTTQEDIARILGIDSKTLRKHYRDELDLAKAKANATIGGALFNKAKSGDTAAMIFWMKTQAGWRETSALAIGGAADMDPIKTEDVGGSAKLEAFLSAVSGRADSGASK